MDHWGEEQTKYFFELTPERILNCVERLGEKCTGRVIQLNSMENRVYEVELDSDPVRSIVAKFYRPGRWNEQQIREEHQYLQELVEDEIPVVAPLLISGESLFTDPDSKIMFAIFPKVRGRNPDELNTEQLTRLGRLLARIHVVGGRSPNKARLSLTPDQYGRENLRYLISSKSIPNDIAPTYKKVAEEICALSDGLFSGVASQRIHGDCHFGNVLWGRIPLGEELSPEGFFLVDFDDTLMGPPVQDIWLLAPGRDKFGVSDRDVLISAYEEMREFSNKTLKLIEPLRALRFMHFSAWIARRYQDPAFIKAFPNFGTREYWTGALGDLNDQLELIRSEV
jgi:Ser/Thr protein kinase RdoA (MazF antagonist)